jgi:mono/diheme cytochrome c family protein
MTSVSSFDSLRGGVSCAHRGSAATVRRTANLSRYALTAFAFTAITVVLHAAAPTAVPAVASDLSPSDRQFFEAKIRPLLVDRCYKCHSRDADKLKGGLMLDTREAWLHGGNTGPAIVPGKPDDSLVIQAVRYTDEDLQMPPKGDKLSDQQIADLTEWVRRGAPDPRSLVAKGSSSNYGGVGKAHWSFQPLKKPAVPTVDNQAWCKTPVDNFVLAKLEANGMKPNEAADKRTLIRRVTFDLTGLPPNERDIQTFLADNSPDAYAKVVDRLLASPHYGERWARYWLDVARYADTKGDAPKTDDQRYPHAWTYRDYVIDAFNRDKPYNQFVFEQLAADRLVAIAEKKAKDAGQPPPESHGVLAALGFLTLGNQFDGRRDDIIADQIDVTTKAFLGLTVACARCHDHKFDPIPTKDYYSLYGVFANSQQPAVLPPLVANPPKTTELLEYFAKATEFQKKEEALEARRQELRRTRPPERTKLQQLRREDVQLHRQMGDLEGDHPGSPPRANALYDVPRPRDYTVLIRGETGHRGDTVPRRFLEILSPDPKKRPEWKNGSGRTELGLSIIDPKNPLTARVLVNRIWQQHWGDGFVSTPDDLGNMSAPPNNPELLDYLAATFIENGWSIKNLHRQIVLSAAYQQSAQNNPQYAETDPNNRLLWRYNLRRLDFETMHDALLTITGELDPTMGGKPVLLSSDGFAKRRAIYTLIDRRNPPELLTQFDFPSPDVESGRRYQTIVPQQALFLMNSPMVIEAARKLVDRPSFAELNSDADRVAALYLAIYQRLPTKKEVELGLRYVKANPAGTGVSLPGDEPAPTPASAKAAKARELAGKQKKQLGRFATQVGGVYEKHTPLDAWTKLAHALFQSNEAMFYE